MSARALDLDLVGGGRDHAASARAAPDERHARASIAKWPLPRALEGRALAVRRARRGALVVALVDRDGGAVMTTIDSPGRPGAASLARPSRSPLAMVALGSSPACAGPTPSDEATLALAFTTQIALSDDGARDLVPAGEGGVALVRWSSARVCIDAIEIGARDLRYEASGGGRRAAAGVHEIVLRGARASVITIENGLEVRQPARCNSSRRRGRVDDARRPRCARVSPRGLLGGARA